VPHPAGGLNPQRDIASMDAELLLNDLIAVERRLERLVEERKKGGGRDRTLIEREIDLFNHFHTHLAADLPLRDLEISSEDEKMISGFGFLSRKPMLVLLNLSDDQPVPQVSYSHQRSAVTSLQGRLEMELAQLSKEDAQLFMSEYGIEELGLSKVIGLSYDLLGLQSFFTVGPDEVRAWTIQSGTAALEAAGVIHTDLQKGFIRAEVIHFEELLSLGGLNEARSKGKLRLEGKEYILRDGEIMHVRFNL
jgi:hypothetical protein